MGSRLVLWMMQRDQACYTTRRTSKRLQMRWQVSWSRVFGMSCYHKLDTRTGLRVHAEAIMIDYS